MDGPGDQNNVGILGKDNMTDKRSGAIPKRGSWFAPLHSSQTNAGKHEGKSIESSLSRNQKKQFSGERGTTAEDGLEQASKQPQMLSITANYSPNGDFKENPESRQFDDDHFDLYAVSTKEKKKISYSYCKSPKNTSSFNQPSQPHACKSRQTTIHEDNKSNSRMSTRLRADAPIFVPTSLQNASIKSEESERKSLRNKTELDVQLKDVQLSMQEEQTNETTSQDVGAGAKKKRKRCGRPRHRSRQDWRADVEQCKEQEKPNQAQKQEEHLEKSEIKSKHSKDRYCNTPQHVTTQYSSNVQPNSRKESLPAAQSHLSTSIQSTETKIKKKSRSLKITKEKVSCEVTKRASNLRGDKQIKEKKSDVLQEIHTKMTDTLIGLLMKKHKEKQICRHKIVTGGGLDSSTREPNDRLLELEKLRQEFFNGCTSLKARVRALDPEMSSLKELSEIQRCLEVECRHLTTALPVFCKRKEILEHISANQVSIILGETGSGKSTQIVQYLYEAGFAENKQIVCTQPRKIAVTMVAKRVAQEMYSEVGGIVGHRGGADSKISNATKIVFTTDYSLMRECMKDPVLSKYSCILVDEAHERQIYTDVLLSVLKMCLDRRPDLKIVVTSATIDPGPFLNFFNCGPVMQVPGKVHPVDIIYEDEDKTEHFKNVEEQAVSKAAEVHINEPAGHILVFLTSATGIKDCISEFENRMKDRQDFRCLPLHGQLSPEKQQEAFDPSPQGIRKIIFATNCAETSMTINGIKYVIDPGIAKQVKYYPKTNMTSLCTSVISKSSADQRKGRAGRTTSGKCYRLYTRLDYDSMQPITQPEILRIHLGQAALKLAEMGTDVQTHEFVEPPNTAAMQSAIKSLQELGALTENGITERGRFIAKLPLDPTLGYLVYEGYKNHMLYDSIVMASVISNGANLFHYNQSEEERQKSAKSKVELGSCQGDSFTWLEVYKSWLKLHNKKQKSKWCHENCLSNKVLGTIHNCVRDVAAILKRELNINIKFEFSSETTAKDLLRKLIFQAYCSSLCFFLGHARAGYFALALNQPVHVHPSSTLAAQDQKPTWIVFTELSKTSRDFVKCLTAVDEAWIVEAVHQGKLNIDIGQIKRNRLILTHREEVGNTVFKHYSGPKLEKALRGAGLLDAIVETNQALLTVDIYSSSEMDAMCLDVIRTATEVQRDRLLSTEYKFDMTEGRVGKDFTFNVILGQGGMVKDIEMPGKSKTVYISKIPRNYSKNDIIDKFENFGEIVDYQCSREFGFWGFVRYRYFTEAEEAIRHTRSDNEAVAVTRTDSVRPLSGKTFELKLSWLRRPVKNHAFITCNSDDDRELLIGQTVDISGRRCDIEESRKPDNPTLVCCNVGEVDVRLVREAVEDILPHSNRGHLEVDLPRERVAAPSQTEIELLHEQLYKQIEFYIEKFHLQIKPPRENDVKQVAFIQFDDPTNGLRACEEMKGRLRMQRQTVMISLKLKTRVIITDKVKRACGHQLHNFESNLPDSVSMGNFTTLKAKVKGGYVITLESSEVGSLRGALDRLTSLLEGIVVDCRESFLTKPRGQKLINKLSKAFDVFIVTDDRRQQIHLYGVDKNVKSARRVIDSYLTENRVEICLKGSDKPPGLLKALITEHGTLDEDFRDRFGLTDVAIDFKRHILSFRGESEKVHEAVACISEIENSIAQLPPEIETDTNTNNRMPRCSACSSVIGSTVEYRLEYCGHAYCEPCLKMQVQNGEFPITCTRENCGNPFVWLDLQYCVNRGWVSENDLAHTALKAYVAANQNKYRYCITPDCHAVYEVTRDKDGCEFQCPLCSVILCTSCHTAYHAGLTCRGMSAVEEFEEQRRARRSNSHTELKHWGFDRRDCVKVKSYNYC